MPPLGTAPNIYFYQHQEEDKEWFSKSAIKVSNLIDQYFPTLFEQDKAALNRKFPPSFYKKVDITVMPRDQLFNESIALDATDNDRMMMIENRTMIIFLEDLLETRKHLAAKLDQKLPQDIDLFAPQKLEILRYFQFDFENLDARIVSWLTHVQGLIQSGNDLDAGVKAYFKTLETSFKDSRYLAPISEAGLTRENVLVLQTSADKPGSVTRNKQQN